MIALLAVAALAQQSVSPPEAASLRPVELAELVTDLLPAEGSAQRGDGQEGDHPTLPSRLIATSFCASTANSIGSSCRTSRTKPLTSSWTASSCERPRCMA